MILNTKQKFDAIWAIGILIIYLPFNFLAAAIVCLAYFSFNEKIRLWWSELWTWLWLKSLFWVTRTTIIVDEREPIDLTKPNLLVANHTSGLDIPLLFKITGAHAKFVAKKEMFKIPFWGWGLYVCGHIPLDRSNPYRAKTAIEKAIKKLENNATMIVFPEGTRSRTGRIQPFKKGSFLLASKTKNDVNIIPVSIKGAFELLPKGKLNSKKGTVNIVIHKSKLSSEFNDSDEMAQYCYNIIKKDLE